MQSYYEINVSLNGQHFFATAPRSLTTAAKTTQVLGEIRRRFPKEQGFEISTTYWKCFGENFSEVR